MNEEDIKIPLIPSPLDIIFIIFKCFDEIGNPIIRFFVETFVYSLFIRFVGFIIHEPVPGKIPWLLFIISLILLASAKIWYMKKDKKLRDYLNELEEKENGKRKNSKQDH
jgi:hypothetical protein